MIWLRRMRRWGKIILPLNVMVAVVVGVCLQYPVFKLRLIDIAYADGREVPADLYDQVKQVLVMDADSNLFSINKSKIADLLLTDEDIDRVEVNIRLPGRLVVRLAPAKPVMLWAGKRVTCLAGDGRVVQAPEKLPAVGCPVGGIGGDGGDESSSLARWRIVEFYQRLVRLDPRWGEVISQIDYDRAVGWRVLLNRGAEQIILGRCPTVGTLKRVVRFLQNVPEDQWQNGRIDARFRGRIILAPGNTGASTPAISQHTDRRDGRQPSLGGRS